MNNNEPLPKEKKLTVVFRVEPGCLGPEGKKHVDEFCEYAQKEVEPIDSDYVHWEIEPRDDKSLPEMEYQVLNKKMNHVQAEKYLQLIDKNLNEFEDHLNQKLAVLIEAFHKRY